MSTTPDFARMLHEGWLTSSDFMGEKTRLDYLGDFIFNFTTYDGELSELFAGKAVEVCEAITNRTTFEYIKDAENYRWFILMCNMPFFAGRLTWGGSIRGAWWDNKPTSFDSCGLWLDGEQCTEIIMSESEWADFIRAIIDFAKEDGR